MKWIFTIFVFKSFLSFSQNEKGAVISTNFQKYDKSLIAPDLRRKHSISLGPVVKFARIADPNSSAPVPLRAWHFGYNRLTLNQRKLKLAVKDRKRTDIKKAFGLHFTLIEQQEHYLMATFFNPFIERKGRLFSFCLFSEYGFGYHYNKNPLNEIEKQLKWHVSMEAIRFRLGRLPLYLNLNVNYALGNNLLAKTRWEVEFMGGLRYYFYRGR